LAKDVRIFAPQPHIELVAAALIELTACMKMPIVMRLLLLTATLFSTALAQEENPTQNGYSIITWKNTAATKEWKEVIDALQEKHQAQLIVCENSLNEALPSLQKQQPRFVAIVGQSTQIGSKVLQDLQPMLRQIDADPYLDVRWGVITGRSAADAMRIVQEKMPLVIERTVSATRLPTSFGKEVECFDELTARRHSLKKDGGMNQEIPLPADDSIAALAQAFADPRTQFIVTSGHATTRDWQPGYSYKNGAFHSRDGVLYGLDLAKKEHSVHSDTPKIYLPCGNCLMGQVDGPDAMALAWMHSAGVRQMAGYLEPTWYGYMGWGILDYFYEQPARFTFAEAFVANQHALIHRLATQKNLSAMDRKGLLFDRDMVAFYGDPAWSATMAAQPDSLWFSQKLTQTADTILLEIAPLNKESSYTTIDTNGSQRGGRPFIAFLPENINPEEYDYVSDDRYKPILGDDFVLFPRPENDPKPVPLSAQWKRRSPNKK
jgi:zinc protease